MNRLVTANRLVLFLWALTLSGLVIFAWRTNQYDRLIALHTFGLGIASAAFAVPLGMALAWTSLGHRRLNRMMLHFTVGMLVIPVFLHVSTWDAAIGKLGWLTVKEGEALKPLVSGWWAAAWIHGIYAAPQVALFVLLGFAFSRRTLEEQALMESPKWRVMLFVRLPIIWPLALVGVFWTIVSSCREIAATDLYQIGTLAEQIYLGYSLGQFNSIVGGWTEEQISAAAKLNIGLSLLILLWLALTVTILYLRLARQEKELDHGQALAVIKAPDSLENRQILFVKRLLSTGLLVILFGIPLANLLIRASFKVEMLNGDPTPVHSIAQLVDVLQRAMTNYSEEFSWSILISLASSTLMILVAILLCWYGRTSNGLKILLALTITVSCTLPGPLMGSLTTILLTQADWEWLRFIYNRTIIPPVMTNILFCWPVAPLLIWFIFRETPSEIVDQARLDGAGEGTILWRFGIVDHRVKLVGCWLLTFSFCFGELSASQLILPPGIDTLPRLMLGLLHAGVDEMTAGITIVMIFGIMLISRIGWRMIHWQTVRHSTPSIQDSP